jgi:hypothetical protein
VVAGGDVDIIDIEQNAAVGPFHDLAQKFPFGHFGNVELGVAADVFHRDGHFQEIARLADFAGGDFGGGQGVRHGQQVVRVTAIHAAPAKVVRKPRRVGPFDQALEFLEMLPVQRLGRTKIGRHAVLHDAILFQDLIQHLQGTSAVAHEVFGNDLEPIDRRLFGQDVVVMRDAQPDADSVIGKAVKGVGGHEEEETGVARPEPARLALRNGLKKKAGKAFFRRDQVTLQPPLPLQLFLPLQPMSPGVAAALAFATIHAFAVMFVRGGAGGGRA